MKNRTLIILIFFTLYIRQITAQNSGAHITLQDVWLYYSFFPKMAEGVYVMNDGSHYAEFSDTGSAPGLWKINIENPAQRKLLVKKNQLTLNDKQISLTDFFFSPDENFLLIKTNAEPIYRHSAKVTCYLFDFQKQKIITVSNGQKILFPKFSPDSKKIAYVKENNLFIFDISTEKEIQVTSDGQINKIKNGWGDWVYEEEFSKPDYFEWNASSDRLAFIRFDESHVKEFTLYYYRDSLYPVPYTFKYPKAGEENSRVSFHIHDLKTGSTRKADTGTETDIYLPRIFSTPDPQTFCLLRLNRRQNKLEYLFYNGDHPPQTVLTDTSGTYVDVHDEVFFHGNKGLLFASERSGYRHIHYLDFKTRLIHQITQGSFDVMKVYGFDEKKGIVFFQSTENGPHRRDIYSIRVDGKQKKRLSPLNGFNNAEFYAGMKYFVRSHSDANTPPVYELCRADGTPLRTLVDNAELKEKLKKYSLSKKEFFTFKNRNGTELYGWMMKPEGFSPDKKYPVYMYAYNGPGSNEVNDGWEILDYMWHQLLCQEGFVVVCVDGRGTMGRGKAFKDATYLQLGGPESDDQIDAAKYLASLPFVNPKKIMFQGWSFGGFMATLLITKGYEHFARAVAVAPVTNWKFYDNIYTERYMRKPSENKDGYEKNTPMHYAKKYKGGLLLIHGDADDNVHVQNSHELAKELIKYGKPFDYFIYPNKNHGIGGGMTRFHVFYKILKFAKELRDETL